MALIKIENLCFSYNGFFEIYNINFELKKGEITTLLGPNGSGKTTLLKCVYGILKPKDGCIYLDGKSLLELSQPELAKNIGCVPQIHNPVFPFKIIDIVVMGRTPYIKMFSSPSKKDYKSAREIISELGISNLAERPYTMISGGEQQLVLMARALMQNPKLLLLDEPAAHLDIKNKVKVLSMVKKVAEKLKIAVLMTIHDPNDAIRFSHNIALMKEGKIIDYGYPDKVINAENLQEIYNMPFIILNQDNHKIVMYELENSSYHNQHEIISNRFSVLETRLV